MSHSTAERTHIVQLNVNVDTSAVRFPAWIALTVLSVVCLAAEWSQFPAMASAAHKFSLSVCILSMLISFGSVICYLLIRHLFMSTQLEIGVTALLLSLWGAALPLIMSPTRSIAVDDVAVQNANLYFGSWAVIVLLAFLAGTLAQDVTGLQLREVAPAVQSQPLILQWLGLTATSVIVWASATRYLVAQECSAPTTTATTANHATACRRTKFAIACGVLSFVTSFVMVVLPYRTIRVDLAVTWCIFILWCFGIHYITFGPEASPGAIIGNLYLSTWGCFTWTAVLCYETTREFITRHYHHFAPPATDDYAANIATGEVRHSTVANTVNHTDAEDLTDDDL